MSPLVQQTDRGSTKPVKVHVGDRRGSLVATELLSTTQRGEQWLYRCDCGGTAIRFTASVNQSVRNGNKPACAQCVRDLSEARADKRDARRDEFFLDLWARWRTLYLPNESECELWAGSAGEWAPDIGTKYDVRIGALFPIGPCQCTECAAIGSLRHSLECATCHKLEDRAFACLICDQAVCVACVPIHKHVDDCTLDEVATHLGISRERARQIEQQAISRVRHKVLEETPAERRMYDSNWRATAPTHGELDWAHRAALSEETRRRQNVGVGALVAMLEGLGLSQIARDILAECVALVGPDAAPELAAQRLLPIIRQAQDGTR